MHGFKSAILEKIKNCLNDTFEPVHDFFFGEKSGNFRMKMWSRHIAQNMNKKILKFPDLWPSQNV